MVISQLLEQLQGIRFVGDGVPLDRSLTGVCSDSRQVGPRDLFVALPGVRSQGVDYLASVIELGCRAALVPHDAQLPGRLARYCVGVENIRNAAAHAACAVFGRPTSRLLTFGVTGTNGKTSTCHILKHILETAGHRVVMVTTVAHQFEDWRMETPNTTPDAPLLQSVLARAVNKGATAAVIEVSAHGVLLDRITGCSFDGLAFTNLSTDHQDFFDGIEPYFAQKLRLFCDPAYHKPRCVASVGTDDEFGRRVVQNSRIPVLTFGQRVNDAGASAGNHVGVSELALTEQGLSGNLSVKGRLFRVETTLASAFNRLNLAGAVALAVGAGVPNQAIERALTLPISVPGRLTKIPSTAPFQVIVDFAHTDSAMRNLLDGLRKDCTGRLIVVFGAGGDKDPARRRTLPQAVIELAEVGIITLDNPRSESPQAIIDTMVGNWREIADKHTCPAALLVEPDRCKAISLALDQARPGDIVVLAGKGHETTQIYADRVEHHDDHAIAQSWLADHYRR